MTPVIEYALFQRDGSPTTGGDITRFRTINICPNDVAFVWRHSRTVIPRQLRSGIAGECRLWAAASGDDRPVGARRGSVDARHRLMTTFSGAGGAGQISRMSQQVAGALQLV